jgi:hypothetical protein
MVFALTEGVGLQAFVVVASRQPLPAYAEWLDRVGPLPWRKAEAGPCWSYFGGELEPYPRERGPLVELGETPAVEALRQFLRQRPGIEASAFVAFPVVKSPHKP